MKNHRNNTAKNAMNAYAYRTIIPVSTDKGAVVMRPAAVVSENPATP